MITQRYLIFFVRVSFNPLNFSFMTSLIFLLVVKSTTSVSSGFTDSVLDLHQCLFSPDFFVSVLLQCSGVYLPSPPQDYLHIPMFDIPQHLVAEAGIQPPYTIGKVIVPFPDGSLCNFCTSTTALVGQVDVLCLNILTIHLRRKLIRNCNEIRLSS